MSLLAIFLTGSVLFFATTWATVAFGVVRMQELQREDLEQGDQVVVETGSGLTELHVGEGDVVQPTEPTGTG